MQQKNKLENKNTPFFEISPTNFSISLSSTPNRITPIIGNTLWITQPQISIPLFTWKNPYNPQEKSLAATSPSQIVRPFCYLSHYQRFIMICLSDLTQYWGNLHGHHTRPYTMPYLRPCGNCHHKLISPTTGDQPSYHSKSRKAINLACSLGSK